MGRTEGVFSSEYCAGIGPNEDSEILVDALSYDATEDARILELGCSSGRHLEALRRASYENLTGVDLNHDALDVMAEYFPRTVEPGTFHIGAIEDILPELETGAFDVVYSAETLKHVHPEETVVFEKVLRVTDDLLVTAENGGNAPTGDARARTCLASTASSRAITRRGPGRRPSAARSNYRLNVCCRPNRADDRRYRFERPIEDEQFETEVVADVGVEIGFDDVVECVAYFHHIGLDAAGLVVKQDRHRCHQSSALERLVVEFVEQVATGVPDDFAATAIAVFLSELIETLDQVVGHRDTDDGHRERHSRPILTVGISPSIGAPGSAIVRNFRRSVPERCRRTRTRRHRVSGQYPNALQCVGDHGGDADVADDPF